MSLPMRILVLSSAFTILSSVSIQSHASEIPTVPVTVDNFVHAASDDVFSKMVKINGLGRFGHLRKPAPVGLHVVARPNRDTLYSTAVFDLDAGPVTITLPDAGKRFMSMIEINEDHYAQAVAYGAGTYVITKEKMGTRYALVAVRTLVDPTNPEDLKKVHALQDEMKVSQNNIGHFDIPNWDKVSEKKVRDALLVLGSTMADTKNSFGTVGEVSPIRHLIGTATLWGGNPDKDAVYLTAMPDHNDGTTLYRLHVKDVPVTGFWSVSVYDAEGQFDANKYGAYTINNITAKKGADGSVDIQFGGCDGKIANCLPIEPGWNYTARLYRPSAEILSGSWTFPQAQPVR